MADMRQNFLMVKTRKQEKLRERDITRSQFLAEIQNEATLQFQNHVRQTFRVSAGLIGRFSK